MATEPSDPIEQIPEAGLLGQVIDEASTCPHPNATSDAPTGARVAAVIEPCDPLSEPVYRVVATPHGHRFHVEVTGLGTTQTSENQPDDVDQTARQFISLMLNVPESEVRMVVEYRV